MAIATTNTVGAGNREDLTNDLIRIEPTDTPGFLMFEKKQASAVLHEWQVDDFSEVKFGGVVEGTDVGAFDNKAANRARLGNRTERLQRTWAVSKEQEAVTTAGVSSEIAEAEFKAMAEIKRDAESLIFSDQDRRADDGFLSSRCRGLGSWLETSGPSDVPAAYRLPSASDNATATGSLTEDILNGIVQSIYENTGQREQKLMFFCGPTTKRTVSKVTSRVEGSTTAINFNVTQAANDKAITLDVNVYDGDFGKISMIPDNFLARSSETAVSATTRCRGYWVNRDLMKVAFLIPTFSNRFEDQGGCARGEVSTILTTECLNPLGFGKYDPTS